MNRQTIIQNTQRPNKKKAPNIDLYVRAWVPDWGAERDSGGKPWPQQKVDYPLWFIGHAQEAMLTDEKLAALVTRAIAVGEIGDDGANDLHNFFAQNGYLCFNTAAGGQVFVATLNEAA